MHKSNWELPSHLQFIQVKLVRPAIVHCIKFGKYERSHQCNVRRLKVYGGMDLSKLHQLYDGWVSADADLSWWLWGYECYRGLENSSKPETLPLQHCIEGQSFPCAHIKIGTCMSQWFIQNHSSCDTWGVGSGRGRGEGVGEMPEKSLWWWYCPLPFPFHHPQTHAHAVPLQSWGNGFNFSIWYIELRGDERESVVAEAMASYTAVSVTTILHYVDVWRCVSCVVPRERSYSALSKTPSPKWLHRGFQCSTEESEGDFGTSFADSASLSTGEHGMCVCCSEMVGVWLVVVKILNMIGTSSIIHCTCGSCGYKSDWRGVLVSVR